MASCSSCELTRTAVGRNVCCTASAAAGTAALLAPASSWTDAQNRDWAESQIVWRGGLRRGRICWNLEHNRLEQTQLPSTTEIWDWLVILEPENGMRFPTEPDAVPRVFWEHAPLRQDELETILRYHVLLTSDELREEYGEQIRAAGHALARSVEKIWNRIFLEDGKLVIEGFDFNFNEEARAAQSLGEIFSSMLEPLFEMKYPDHPAFSQTLGMTEVSSLVKDLFSGARQNLPDIQQLAATFAAPLGLVAQRGESFVLESEENLLELPYSRSRFFVNT